jgi:ribonuclease HI
MAGFRAPREGRLGREECRLDRWQLQANGVRGRGGWAALIEQAGTFREISGSAHSTTHNRMELTAICEALETLTGTIQVRTDSA